MQSYHVVHWRTVTDRARSLDEDSTRLPGQQASVDRQTPCYTRNGHVGPNMLVDYVGPNYQESGHAAQGAALRPVWHSLKKRRNNL